VCVLHHQAYLQQRLGPYLTVATLNANLLRNLMTAWLVYDEQRQRYLNFDEAAELVEACKQQQQEEAEQQQLQKSCSSNAAATLDSNDTQAAREPVITAAYDLAHLLGKKVATNGRGTSNGQQEQLAGSSSSSAAGAAGA
jgi:hypothetical protein